MQIGLLKTPKTKLCITHVSPTFLLMSSKDTQRSFYLLKCDMFGNTRVPRGGAAPYTYMYIYAYIYIYICVPFDVRSTAADPEE